MSLFLSVSLSHTSGTVYHNDKCASYWPIMTKNSVSHSVSHKRYIMWLPLMVHICKMIISPADFIFSKYWFSVKTAKNCPEWRKILLVMLPVSGTTCHCCHYVFHFFKILIFLVVRGIRDQKMIQNDKKFCLLHSISQEPYMTWLSCVKWYLQAFLIFFSKFWFCGLLVE